jgi:rSAM/selenodomain-associated transferase 1
LRLVVMAKVPVAGLVKTRVAREAGVGAATRFARHAMQSLLRRVARHGPWETTVAVAPDQGIRGGNWAVNTPLTAQGGGDLGVRMQRIIASTGPGPIVIIGTDIPGITAAHIARAFRLLGSHDAVLGPASDGGYWLVGLRRRPRLLRPFTGVRWSSPEALSDTLRNLAGKSVAFLPLLDDVDSAADLERSGGRAGRVVG